ncbi:hypothetical protein MMC06_003681 [Schaereria dolodes]|nr:hypothetical protein [Schaereria dolodes]
MPSIRYYNQTAPFWDFVANLESAAGEHPFFNAGQGRQPTDDEARGPPQHEGQIHQEPSHREGPPQHDGPPPPSEPSHLPPPHHHEGPGCGRHHHRGGPRRGGWGGLGRHGRGGFPFGGFQGGFPGQGFGGFGGFSGREGPRSFDANGVAQFFAEHLGLTPSNDNQETASSKEKTDSKDFTPQCDVFDTENAFTIHVSLPGAKKEDVGVNWDADKSELSVAGVIYRPGDEEFLKTLAMDEREVGVFERKVRLGSRARPAQVEVDEISAKMEDGILIVTVPKTDAEYVEVKKVDIE